MRAVALIGRSGSGKTHLVVRLTQHFVAQGLQVATVKHTHHHDFQIDLPGKDSWRHRDAGAQETLLLSDQRFALLGDLRAPLELADLQRRLQPADVLLIEGYSSLRGVPRIEVFRSFLGPRPLAADGDGFVAVALPTYDRTSEMLGLPLLDLDDTAAIAEFILALPPTPAPGGGSRRGPSTRLAHLHSR